MAELINFIPKTLKECRELLITLQEKKEGATVTDRYGVTADLDASEVEYLVSLIEKQIGEKTPKVEKAPQAKAPAPKKKVAPKTAKK